MNNQSDVVDTTDLKKFTPMSRLKIIPMGQITEPKKYTPMVNLKADEEEVKKSHLNSEGVLSRCKTHKYITNMLHFGKEEIKLRNLQTYKLYRLHAIGDGTCLVHSILQLINKNNYNKYDINNKKQIAYNYRNELSNFLQEENKDYPEYNNWSVINNSSLMDTYITSYNQDYVKSLKQFQDQLNNSADYLNEDSVSLISVKEDIDIYVIKICQHGFIDTITSIYKESLNRKAIIILNLGNIHYEPIIVNDDYVLDYNNKIHSELLMLLKSSSSGVIDSELNIDEIIVKSIVDINKNVFYQEPTFQYEGINQQPFVIRYNNLISQGILNENDMYNLKQLYDNRVKNLNVLKQEEIDNLNILSLETPDDKEFINQIIKGYLNVNIKIPYFSYQAMQNNQLFYNKYLEIIKKLDNGNNKLNLDYLEQISPITLRRIKEYVDLNNLKDVEFRIIQDNYYKFKDFIKFIKIIDDNFQFFQFLNEFNDLFKHFIIMNNEQLSIHQTVDAYINIKDQDFIKKLKYLLSIFEIINPFIMKHLNNNTFYSNIMFCTKTFYQINIVVDENLISSIFNTITFIINYKNQSDNLNIISNSLIEGLNVLVDKNIIFELVKSIKIDDIKNYHFEI
jgi:hypothetical protein